MLCSTGTSEPKHSSHRIKDTRKNKSSNFKKTAASRSSCCFYLLVARSRDATFLFTYSCMSALTYLPCLVLSMSLRC